MQFSFFILIVVASCKKHQLRDCVRPWQSPVLSIPTLLSPSRPLECRPEAPSSCPKGHNSACQFSLRYYKYICCQDSANAEPPQCPKFHDSLQLVCAGNDSVCPRGFRCLPTRTDPSLRICCRPNANISHPEPETTFRENRLVPQILPSSPSSQLQITFDNITLVMGQLLDKQKVAILDKQPELKAKELSEEKQYVVVLVDTTSSQMIWFVINAAVRDSLLKMDRSSRTLVAYSPPPIDDEGTHVVVAVVFEQTGSWKAPRVAADGFSSFREFIDDAPVIPVPVAGAFYAYTNKDDERA